MYFFVNAYACALGAVLQWLSILRAYPFSVWKSEGEGNKGLEGETGRKWKESRCVKIATLSLCVCVSVTAFQYLQ